MKRNAFFGLALIMACGGLVAYVLAQQAAPAHPESKLSLAETLIQAGQPEAARELLATIPANDPEYAAGKHYDALALATTQDRLGFLNAMEKLPALPANVSPAVALELTVRHIEALSFYRKFEELLPKALTFQEQHADAPDAAAVREHLLAGLFERGLKKTFEAGKLKDEKFQQRWTEGRANLEQFLALAAAFPVTNYTVLPKRNLRDDLWRARVILGDEATALAEITAQNAAEREKFSLLRVLLYPKIQPNYADLNLHRMSNFLAQFPESRSRVKVEFEMANVALLEGERLVSKARLTPDAKTAAVPRAAAVTYLELAQGLFPRVVEDKEAGIGATELREARVRMLRVFYAQDDWASLSERAAQLLADAPEEKEWLVIKLYAAAGLARERKLTEAASAFDEVLAIGFRGTPSYDGLLISAARWRIRVARQSGDDAAARRVVEQVRNADCYGSIKRTFLEKFGSITAQAAPVSK